MTIEYTFLNKTCKLTAEQETVSLLKKIRRILNENMVDKMTGWANF
jgi:hypothetical protein